MRGGGPTVGPLWLGRCLAGPAGGPKQTWASPAALQATDSWPTGEPSVPQASSLTGVSLTGPLSPAAPTIPPAGPAAVPALADPA